LRYVKCQTDTEFTLDKSRVLWYSVGMNEIPLNNLIADALRSLAILCVVALALKDAAPSSAFYAMRKTILSVAGITVAASLVLKLAAILSRLL